MRRRLILGVLLGLELLLAGLIWQEARNLERHCRAATEALLTDTAQVIARLLAADLHLGQLQPDRVGRVLAPLAQAKAPPAKAPTLPAEPAAAALHIHVADQTGRALFDSHRPEVVAAAPASPSEDALLDRYVTTLDRNPATDALDSMVFVAAPILWQAQAVGEVRVGKPIVGFELSLQAARWHFLLGGLYMGLALVVLAGGFTLWWLRPLDLFAEYAALLRRGHFRALPNVGRSTLGWLGTVLDALRDAIAGRRYVEEYVQALTHEIKTPLATIQANAEVLEDSMSRGQRQHFLTHIQEAVHHLQAVVERLLELSAVETRRTLTEKRTIRLADVATEAITALSPEAKTKHVTVTTAIPAGAAVRGQRALLVCAVVNLLQNAIEFSPEAGCVELAVSVVGDDCTLTVHDQGPGIPAYARNRLFEHFYSLPRPGSGKRSTGLGLTLVREIAELHHGRIEVTNHADGGAIARLQLPQA
ncbi:two-component system sensor histidine kinase CreC [Methylolobus aquaticus]